MMDFQVRSKKKGAPPFADLQFSKRFFQKNIQGGLWVRSCLSWETKTSAATGFVQGYIPVGILASSCWGAKAITGIKEEALLEKTNLHSDALRANENDMTKRGWSIFGREIRRFLAEKYEDFFSSKWLLFGFSHYLFAFIHKSCFQTRPEFPIFSSRLSFFWGEKSHPKNRSISTQKGSLRWRFHHERFSPRICRGEIFGKSSEPGKGATTFVFGVCHNHLKQP